MSDDKEEPTMTLVDFLEEEKEIELTAQEVLGPCDVKNCTYDLGYVPRQALYACLTCNPTESADFKFAGICLACSYHCHEGHNLVELYTKRFFRCDCGNSKFPGKKCNLTPNKDDVNEKNKYNQNFKGVYCTCERPYPDPEADDESQEGMIQCIICEDWYHISHLNNPNPADCQDANYSEVICENCTENLPFLNYYLDKSVNIQLENKEDAKKPEEASKEGDDVKVDGEAEKDCYRKTNPILKKLNKGATFWPSTFRSILCACPDCVEEYKKCEVPWICDEQDTAHAYQEKAKNVETSYEKGMKALQQMDHVSQVEALHSYNDLKTELHAYLQGFAEKKRVVREEDIHAFFDEMKSRKKPRLGNPPYLCS